MTCSQKINSKYPVLTKGNYFTDFPGGSDGKVSVYNAGDPASIPGSGRSPGEGNGYTLQYSCRENPMGGGAWRATVPGVAKSQTRLRDRNFHFSLCVMSKCRV